MASVAIVGDYNARNQTHLDTDAALAQLGVEFDWVPTEAVAEDGVGRVGRYDGIFVAPASPYRSMDGALAAIRHARERGVPLVATWGGFQHVLVEYARNVLGLGDADHAETSPEAETPVVNALACSLVGQTHPVNILSGTRAAALYGEARSDESFYCSYGLNPGYREQLEANGMRVSGIDDEGDVRIAELDDHPFYLGTLFIPQSGPRRGTPHPLLQGFAAAAGA